MLTFDRLLLFKAYVWIAVIGLPIGKLSARVAVQKYDKNRYEKIWDQHKKRKKQKKRKKKKNQKNKKMKEEERSDAAILLAMLDDYKEVIGVGCLCLFFGYVLLSPDTQAPLPSGGGAKPTYIIDKDPATIKYKISKQEFAKTLDRAWNAHPDFTAKEKNDAGDFKGYDGMAEKLVEEVAAFEKCKKENNWDYIWGRHYDWWIFPIPFVSSGHGTEYVVYKKDVEELKKYVYHGKNATYHGWTYVKLQRRAAELLLESMGWWDSYQQKITGKCTRVHTAVRRGKMINGLILWNPDLYAVANALTLELEKNGKGLGPEYQAYITRKLL